MPDAAVVDVARVEALARAVTPAHIVCRVEVVGPASKATKAAKKAAKATKAAKKAQPPVDGADSADLPLLEPVVDARDESDGCAVEGADADDPS